MGLIGGHMSIAGGLYRAIERGDSLKCESIQIFIQSSRTWKINPFKTDEVSQFISTFKQAKHVKKIVAHNSYLLNLSTTDSSLREKSVDYFAQTMERCEELGILGLITHPGSHLGAGVDAGIKATSKSIDEVLKRCRGFRSKIILENTAGQGGCIGHDFTQLRRIVEQTSNPEAIDFCFDTQHAFAAGYDLRTNETYESTMSAFDRELSLNRIAAFHINDALKEFDCRVDRHANIGKGFLGKEAFRPLVNDERFKNIPMCLETDPGEDDVKHKQDLKTLRSLIEI
jgi:deoxyribonuclease IV